MKKSEKGMLKKIKERMKVVVKKEDYRRWIEWKKLIEREVEDIMRNVKEDFFEDIKV